MNQTTHHAPELQRDWASAASNWWRALQPYADDGMPNRTSDRGALARLRRASTSAESLAEPVVFDLYRRLGFRAPSDEWLALTAVAAMVLAHVRKNKPREHPARTVGRESFADKDFKTAAMKPLRFKRLLAARGADELVREMRRLVQLAGNEVNVGQLAVDVLRWRDTDDGDRMRVRWGYEYLAAGHDAPPDSNSDAPPPTQPTSTEAQT